MFLKSFALSVAFLSEVLNPSVFNEITVDEQLHKQHICLAETIYYEARGDSLIGREAVADVVLNRVNHKVFPNSICEVVYQKGQFSWTKNKYAIRELQAWEEAKSIAWRKLQDELNGRRKDVSQSATFFSTGYYHKNTIKIGKIGNYHIFFRLK